VGHQPTTRSHAASEIDFLSIEKEACIKATKRKDTPSS
jgi:hypothetical protein